MLRHLIVGLVLLMAYFTIAETQTFGGGMSLRRAQRMAIRSMPITQRPDRPLHFYGNTVRRLSR